MAAGAANEALGNPLGWPQEQYQSGLVQYADAISSFEQAGCLDAHLGLQLAQI